jgi:hypothetical protein
VGIICVSRVAIPGQFGNSWSIGHCCFIPPVFLAMWSSCIANTSCSCLVFVQTSAYLFTKRYWQSGSLFYPVYVQFGVSNMCVTFCELDKGRVRWRETPCFHRCGLDPWPVCLVPGWARIWPRQYLSSSGDANTVSDGGHTPSNCFIDDSSTQLPAHWNNQQVPGLGKRQCHLSWWNLRNGGSLQWPWAFNASTCMCAPFLWQSCLQNV